MSAAQNDLFISADSHVIESPELWAGLLPEDFWSVGGEAFNERQGGHDPIARIGEMAVDGVKVEILYPSLALKLFSLEDAELQARCFRRYNGWLADFCAAAPNRFVGVGLIPCYDIDRAVEEVRWCHAQGLKGCEVWQTPPAELSFCTDHYDKLWAACAALHMPVSLHILTGFDYSRNLHAGIGNSPDYAGLEVYRGASNLKLLVIANALFDLIFSGALDRHLDLKIVVVENEVGWLPFLLDQWDYYYKRLDGKVPVPLGRQPSQCFRDQIYLTFFRDQVGTRLLDFWGQDNCMWSNDYPHGNSTWPNSHAVVASSLAHLDGAAREKLLRGNVSRLYGLTDAQAA